MVKAVVAVVAALGMLATVGLGAVVWADRVDGEPFEAPDATTADLQAVAGSRVFFGHRSVGFNVLDGLPEVYERAGVDAPSIVESREAPEAEAIVHVEIGENGRPLEKIANFDRIMREGMAEQVDAAVLKLCYVDLRAGEADVDEIFTAYRDTLAALARDYPATAFVAATAPLTTERGPKGKLKALFGRGDRYGPEHNVLRQRFNSLVRAEFDEPGRLFDIAAVQSTDPSGERVAFSSRGETYYSLSDDYAKDPGHLNARGAQVAASAFIAVLADALA
ncbi:hypothetical protein GCM10011376_28010 [Nocardioides flavus (ex Wang et al. 2016)]|uniref:GDSL-like Lipase/Acylhydrolase family protein n=1 Tax=Nocardioides flavus (ex Wang et al. 2016) TaxID=2058780 RepID=A0ABQ3HKV2_9ACTN|nr:hypothetical protein [Nocardioides flavus (ex Wang et al. 2016)]GHE18191.1 hypothetical protein GCM10011376_28010 [Nocardioides flavus (ex Wang et al. 2016)]